MRVVFVFVFVGSWSPHIGEAAPLPSHTWGDFKLETSVVGSVTLQW